MAIAAAASAVVTAGLAATALAKGSDYVCKGAITRWLTTSDIKDGLAASGGQTKARYAVGNACVTDGHVVLLGDSLVLSNSPSCVEHFVSLAGAAVTVRGNVIHLEPADGEPPVLIWTAGSVSNLAAHLRQAAQLESLADSWLEELASTSVVCQSQKDRDREIHDKQPNFQGSEDNDIVAEVLQFRRSSAGVISPLAEAAASSAVEMEAVNRAYQAQITALELQNQILQERNQAYEEEANVSGSFAQSQLQNKDDQINSLEIRVQILQGELRDVRAAQRKHLRSLEEESAALLAEKRHNEQEIAELKNAQLSTLEEQSRARTAVKEAKEAEIMELRQRLTEETQRAEECRQKLEEQRRIIKEEARMDAAQEVKKESSHAYPNKDQLSELQELRRRLFEEEGRRKLVERQAQGLASMLNPPAVRPNPSSPPSSKINSQGWQTSPGRATKGLYFSTSAAPPGGAFPVPVPLRLRSSSGSQPCSPAQIRF